VCHQPPTAAIFDNPTCSRVSPKLAKDGDPASKSEAANPSAPNARRIHPAAPNGDLRSLHKAGKKSRPSRWRARRPNLDGLAGRAPVVRRSPMPVRSSRSLRSLRNLHQNRKFCASASLRFIQSSLGRRSKSLQSLALAPKVFKNATLCTVRHRRSRAREHPIFATFVASLPPAEPHPSGSGVRKRSLTVAARKALNATADLRPLKMPAPLDIPRGVVMIISSVYIKTRIGEDRPNNSRSFLSECSLKARRVGKGELREIIPPAAPSLTRRASMGGLHSKTGSISEANRKRFGSAKITLPRRKPTFQLPPQKNCSNQQPDH
jgi:hypothetical protein